MPVAGLASFVLFDGAHNIRICLLIVLDWNERTHAAHGMRAATMTRAHGRT
jgi:hypothetical protein